MAKIKISKKGVFFTFIAIAMLSLLFLIFTPQADINLSRESQATQIRIRSIDNYINVVKTSYFETVLATVTQKAVLSMVLYINKTNYLTASELDKDFYEVMVEGQINDVPIDSITGYKIMENNTLQDWSEKISETGYEFLNVNTTIQILNVTVLQTRPWRIDSKLTINLTVISNVATWNQVANIPVSVTIEGMLDPYYLKNTNGLQYRAIKRSTIEFGQWNISYVRDHIRNGTYIHWESSRAPSYLMRMVNDTSNSSCCGIESFINPNLIVPKDVRESYTDYLFWTHTYQNNCTQLYNLTKPPAIEGLWDEFEYFKLDLDAVVKYNLTDQSVVNC